MRQKESSRENQFKLLIGLTDRLAQTILYPGARHPADFASKGNETQHVRHHDKAPQGVCKGFTAEATCEKTFLVSAQFRHGARGRIEGGTNAKDA